MATDESEFWSTTSAFVPSTRGDGFGTGSGGGGHHMTSAVLNDDYIIAVGSGNSGSGRGAPYVVINATLSPAVAVAADRLSADDLTVSTVSGGNSTAFSDDDETPTFLLWLPYIVFTIILFSLIAMSFIRFHFQRGSQIRRRQEELSDKRPYRPLQQPTPDHFRLLGPDSDAGSGGLPNGRPLSGNYIPEQMNLFVQYSQVLPDDCYFGVDDPNTTSGSSRSNRKSNGNSKRGGLNRRPLVFTFNSNGSMVDIRCDEEERTNTFRLVPNADSAGGDEAEVCEIDLGNGDLNDLDPSFPTPLTPASSLYSNRHPSDARNSTLNLIPPPPKPSSRTTPSPANRNTYSANSVRERPTSAGPVSAPAAAGGVGGSANGSGAARYHHHHHPATTNNSPALMAAAVAAMTSTSSASHSHRRSSPTSGAPASRYPTQNHVGHTAPSSAPVEMPPTQIPAGIPPAGIDHLRPLIQACDTPPPRPLSNSTVYNNRHQQQPLSTSTPQRYSQMTADHNTRPVSPMHHHQHVQQHRLSTASTSGTGGNMRPNHHPVHHSPHSTHRHHPRRHYSPLDADRHRKDLIQGGSDDEGEINCAAEALLLWQKRV